MEETRLGRIRNKMTSGHMTHTEYTLERGSGLSMTSVQSMNTCRVLRVKDLP